MKKYLIPVDFSKLSEKVISFVAKNIGNEQTEIHIVHAYQPPIADPISPVGAINDLHNNNLERIKHSFNAYKDKIIKRHPELKLSNVKVITHMDFGFPVDVISRKESELNPDMVFVGTTGASTHLTIIGSVAAGLAKRLKNKTMFLPGDFKTDKPKNIVVATSYELDDVEMIQDVMKMYNPWQHSVQLLHVSDLDSSVEDELRIEFLENLRSEFDMGLLKAKTEKLDNVIAGIEKFVGENNVDLLVMRSTKKNLFQQIFNRSVVKQTVFHTEVPVLVFH